MTTNKNLLDVQSLFLHEMYLHNTRTVQIKMLNYVEQFDIRCVLSGGFVGSNTNPKLFGYFLFL